MDGLKERLRRAARGALPRGTDASLDHALDRALRLLERHEGRGVIPSDDGFPRRLLDVRPSPTVVFLVGSWTHVTPTVAVVGARDATDDGMDVARDLAASLARAGVAVVSGLARGIDAAAHRGALDAGGLSGAVLGTGIERAYPRSNAGLQERLSRSLGLMSEILPGTAPTAATFATRNRLLAALSDVVVVVQGRERSGSLITAREAARMGRRVAALPWDSREPLSEAPHRLIREGIATLARGVEDVLEMLPGAPLSAGAESTPREIASASLRGVDALSTELGELETRLYRVLRERPLPLDRLASACSLSAAELMAALVTLELSGLARRTPGGFARRLSRR